MLAIFSTSTPTKCFPNNLKRIIRINGQFFMWCFFYNITAKIGDETQATIGTVSFRVNQFDPTKTLDGRSIKEIEPENSSGSGLIVSAWTSSARLNAGE